MREAWGREAKKKTSVGRREELAREESRQVCLMFPLASRLLVCLPLLIFSIWFYYSYWFQIEVIEALLWLALFHIDCFSFWICWYLFFFTTINPLMVMQYGSFGHPFFSMSDLCSFSPPNSPPISIPITFPSSTTHTQAHANADTDDTMETESLIQAIFSKFSVGVDFSTLQAGCIAGILAWTSPRDACRMSTVSPEFLRATKSNALWEMFLPSNYQEIIEVLCSVGFLL